MADMTNPATTQLQMPDLAAWQKALPYIFALATAILTAFGTGNWVLVGTEALKDVPNILMTLGLTSGGVLSGIGMLWSAIHNNSKTTGLIQKLSADLQGLKSKIAGVDPNELTTFLDSLKAGMPSQPLMPNVPTLSLPGVSFSIDPNVFGNPTADDRKKLVDLLESMLANLEPKPATAL
jgi:hypothetical protein